MDKSEIHWVDGKCAESAAHYFVAVEDICYGSIFICRYCHSVKWLPSQLRLSFELQALMQKLGADAGYCKMVSKMPGVVESVVRWQNHSNLSEGHRLAYSTQTM